MSYRKLVLLASLIALLSSHSTAQSGDKPRPIKRPAIIGVAHIGLKTDDLTAARNFYGHYLGYQEPFTLDKPSGGLMLTYFKVNDHQYIEIFPELKSETEDRLSHIAFETVNIEQLRNYLASSGVKVPEKLKLGLDGNVSMMIPDPDGHNVEFVEYVPGSLHSNNFGKFLPETRISDRIIHVGITVRDRAAADKFYQEILGFHEMWRGGRTDDRTDWVDRRGAEGTDWRGYVLKQQNQPPNTLRLPHPLPL